MKNEFMLKILDDGRVVVTTGEFAAGDHLSAEQFFRALPSLLGAESVKVSRVAHQQRRHTHTHQEHGHHH